MTHRLSRASLCAALLAALCSCDRSAPPDARPAKASSVAPAALRPSDEPASDRESPQGEVAPGEPQTPAAQWVGALASFPPPGERVEKQESAWRSELGPKEFDVLRKEGTEPAFSSPLLKEKRPGLFVCGACGNPVFGSETKFNSGTGWPSFYEPVQKGRVSIAVDRTYGMVRKEVECARCDSHLGHVFEDGPEPTGLRYCINGLALDFKPASELPTADGAAQ